jgi:hypothetical protein
MPKTWTKHRLERVPALIQKLYEVTDALDEEFKEEKRKFTPDGHLVGSLGEILAAYAFDLELSRSSTKGHDAATGDGKKIEIKMTGGTKNVALRSEPQFLIVLQLDDRGINLIYNGPGAIPWKNRAKKQSNGQFTISLSKLRTLNETVSNPLPQLRDFPAIHRR